jgi:hypothetical protein
MVIDGPLAIEVGGAGTAGDHGRMRWQGEALLTVTGASGGLWGGLRRDGHRGPSTSRTAAIVAGQESGTSVVTGYLLRSPQWGVSVETARNLDTDGQIGRLAFTWADPGPGHSAGRQVWWGRVGLLPAESRVSGRGLDYALARDLGPGLLVIGLRDNEMSNSFVEDMQGRRHLLWAGLGQAPELTTSGPVVWQGWWEAGLGWRHSTVRSKGFLQLDGEQAFTVDSAVARIAAGGGPRVGWGPDAYGGVLLLVEGLAASRTANTEITIHDPDVTSVIRRRQDYPVEGPAAAVILSLFGRWAF